MIIKEFFCFQQNSLGRNQMPQQPLVLIAVQASSFFNSFPSLRQSFMLPLEACSSFCSTCVTFGTSFHSAGHQVLPNPLAKEAQNFFRDDKYPKDVLLPACLDYLQPVRLIILHCYLSISESLQFLFKVQSLLKKNNQLKSAVISNSSQLKYLSKNIPQKL